jgi:hypothetical protein
MQQERNSAGSAQPWNSDRNGPGLRGGGMAILQEPEEMSEDEEKGVLRLRGGEGSSKGSEDGRFSRDMVGVARWSEPPCSHSYCCICTSIGYS